LPTACLTSSVAHPHLAPFPTRRSSDLSSLRWWCPRRPLASTRQLPSRRRRLPSLSRWLSSQTSDHGGCLSRRVAQPSRSRQPEPDRKSTRLNSSHVSISYAVFCLKKKS